MNPGDLVRLYEPNRGGEYFTVGNVNRDLPGWSVPQGAIALVAEIIAGDLRLACHLADFAAWAAPDNAAIHERRAQIYKMRRDAESSLMAKGIFMAAARDSERVVNEGD